MLSEGLKLQDATHVVNYDIHWNPVRLMQRIGRVDRRLNPDIEREMIADHPEMAEVLDLSFGAQRYSPKTSCLHVLFWFTHQ